MDFFISTNFAFLIIIAGVLLSVFAILTPGTGIFELGALLAYVLAGWAIFNQPINIWALGILVLGVFPFLLAVRRTKQRANLVVSSLALIIGSAFLFRGEGWQPGVHPVLAAVGSISAGGLLWLMTVKILDAEAAGLAHDMTKIIGACGEARTDIHSEGSVYVLGEMWTARSGSLIKNGSKVRVLGREGFILDVETVENGKD
ncbi:MAG: hypothetical protein FVQ83_11030 [Chloroflexi bacterium]|nr:hypothetical protein [Chloroflexota bacterium]